MIRKEYLEHWIKEIEWQLNGIKSEVKPEKVLMGGINVGKTGESFVSFDYLQEKTDRIEGILTCIRYDMTQDGRRRY